MELNTTRFGRILFAPDEILIFDAGLGDPSCRQWLVLSDESHPYLYWLQSVSCPDLAWPAVSPRQIDPKYALHLRPSQLTDPSLIVTTSIFSLCILQRSPTGLSCDLKRPIIVNPANRHCERIVLDSIYSAQFELPRHVAPLQQSA